MGLVTTNRPWIDSASFVLFGDKTGRAMIGSALLAFLIFGETFTPLQFVGFALLLGGIYLASRSEAGTGSR